MKLEKGKIYDFTVVEKALDKKSVFIQDEFGNKHYYPRLFEIGIKIKLKILNIDETRKCFFQELRDYSKYKVSEIYEFDVIELVSKNKDNYYFKVIDSESKLISTVKAFKSQLPPNKIPQKLMCKVIEIDTANDRFIIHQFDSMPFQTIFEDGEFFDFKYIEISDSDPDYIIVKGIDGKLHSLLKPFGTNVSILKENDIIKYVCKHELGIVKFRYFITFEDIIKYRILKQNTFDALKNSNSPLAIKLYTDFNSKSNLWILSFCKLLQDEYRDCIEKDEYEKALMYGEVLVEIENWIINSGFITSFNSNIEEKMNYAISTYERYVIFTKALDIFLAKRFFHYFDNFCS